jgi:hypothetical protein
VACNAEFNSAAEERRGLGPDSGSLSESAKGVDDLALVGEASLVVFREDLLLPREDVEDASASADELRVFSELRLDLGRQTGGPGQVVSNAAVMDDDLHFDSLALISTAVMLS